MGIARCMTQGAANGARLFGVEPVHAIQKPMDSSLVAAPGRDHSRGTMISDRFRHNDRERIAALSKGDEYTRGKWNAPSFALGILNSISIAGN